LVVHHIPWLEGVTSQDALLAANPEDSPLSALLDTVEHSKYGWENITPSLLHLGTVLMDTTVPKGGKNESTSSNSRSLKDSRVSKKTIASGTTVLLRTFHHHEVMRKSILDIILSRVITLHPNAVFYINLLQKIISECSHDLLDLTPKVKLLLFCFKQTRSKNL
jgi:hypothetical protein